MVNSSIAIATYTSKDPTALKWGIDIQFGFYNKTGKTFKLLDLPTNEPTVVGAIWVDSSGILHIKTK